MSEPKITWGDGVLHQPLGQDGLIEYLPGYIGNHIMVFSINVAFTFKFWKKKQFELVSHLPGVGDKFITGTMTEMKEMAEQILQEWIVEAGLKS